MKINNKTKNILVFKSFYSKDLTNSEIYKICKLKNQKWKFGITSQLNWFKKNINKSDIHNLFFINKNLVGYTTLRKKTCKIKNLSKKTKYLLFDTFIIKKNYQGKKLSNLLMDFNKIIIKQTDNFSILLCEKTLSKYYKKRGWYEIKIEKEDIKFNNILIKSKIMAYNIPLILKKLITLK